MTTITIAKASGINMPWRRLVRLLAFGTAFLHVNNYFGWNRLPSSDAELFADLCVLAFLVAAVWPRNETTLHVHCPKGDAGA